MQQNGDRYKTQIIFWTHKRHLTFHPKRFLLWVCYIYMMVVLQDITVYHFIISLGYVNEISFEGLFNVGQGEGFTVLDWLQQEHLGLVIITQLTWAISVYITWWTPHVFMYCRAQMSKQSDMLPPGIDLHTQIWKQQICWHEATITSRYQCSTCIQWVWCRIITRRLARNSVGVIKMP